MPDISTLRILTKLNFKMKTTPHEKRFISLKLESTVKREFDNLIAI